MATPDQRIFELLEAINARPGQSAGQLLARTSLVTDKNFRPVVADMKRRGLIVTTGWKQLTAYHLTDTGRASIECGELPLPSAQQEAEPDVPADEFVDIPVFGALPEVTAGADEVILEAQVCEPLPVIDLDQLTLDMALAEVRQLTAEKRKPANFDDCITFLREFSDCVKARYPVAAAMLSCSANHMERVFEQDAEASSGPAAG